MTLVVLPYLSLISEKAEKLQLVLNKFPTLMQRVKERQCVERTMKL